MSRTADPWRSTLVLLTSALAAPLGATTTDLPKLRIDTTEVSIARFAVFAKDTGFVSQAEREGGGFEFAAGWERMPGTSWREPNRPGESDPRWPAVHLNFGEAQAFCRWAGGRLPSHAEWLSAAFTEQRTSPPTPWQRGRTYAWPTGESPQGANTSGDDPWPNAAPVGATRAGVNGLYDMGANVWEWTTDAQGDTRQTVGGSWWYPAYQMAADVRAFKPEKFYAVYIGFRCVYPLDKP
jgi:formylglycine-generating enzyme